MAFRFRLETVLRGRRGREEVLARDLLLHQDYEWALAWRRERERRHLEELAAACEEKREALLARSREKKVLENLKERQYKLWRQEEARREQKLLDELGGRLPLARSRQERGT